MKTINTLLLAATLCASLAAQEEKVAEKTQSKTQLEAFAAETGVVVIKAYSDIGNLKATIGHVTVSCMEFKNASTGNARYGIVFKVSVLETVRSTRENSSHIDYEEIDALIAGIDYISKATADVTKLAEFEVTYATKGNLAVSVISRKGGKRSLVVRSGHIGSVTVLFEIEKISELRAFVVQAKAKLDEIKK